MMRLLAAAAATALLTTTLAAQAGRTGGDDQAGRQAYERVCKVCHGDEGRGGAGPTLVPFERELEDVMTIVRDGTGQMPPISAERVSDDELAAIVRYLKSLKAPASTRIVVRVQ
ncbi:MAG: cytochrome c [Vicinamibacterales bacterium]